MVARSTPPTPPAPTPAHIEELPGGQVRALTVARQHADHVGMSDEELVAAVLHPQDGWLSPQDGTSLVRIHDGCAVVVAADDDTLILSAMTTERAFEKRRAAGHPHSSGGRRKPGSGSPTGRRPQDTDALLAMCTEHGFDHELTRGGHYRLTHPQHPSRTVSLSATPSDSRSILNSVTAIRSVFGIDVRQQPDPSAART
jgi:predicted RNA binding protein YcfA (HicA-like mRNA interferase family)